MLASLMFLVTGNLARAEKVQKRGWFSACMIVHAEHELREHLGVSLEVLPTSNFMEGIVVPIVHASADVRVGWVTVSPTIGMDVVPRQAIFSMRMLVDLTRLWSWTDFEFRQDRTYHGFEMVEIRIMSWLRLGVEGEVRNALGRVTQSGGPNVIIDSGKQGRLRIDVALHFSEFDGDLEWMALTRLHTYAWK